MNLLTVYCRTSKGARALSLKNKVLPPSHMQVLTKTDSKLDAKSVMLAIGKLTEYQYTQILIQLINDGFIIAKSDFDETAFFASNTIHPMVVEELQTKQFFDTSFGSAITRSAGSTPVATLPKTDLKQDGKARAQAELDEEAENIAQVQAAIQHKLKLEAEAEAKAKAEAEIAAILAKHQHKPSAQTKPYIDIDEEAFGDTFSAIDGDDDRWHPSDNQAEENESTTNIFKNIAASIQEKSKAPTSKSRFSLLKVVGLILHYLVTFVTRWLGPLALVLAGLIIAAGLLSHLPIVMSPFIEHVETLASKNIGERTKIHKMHTSLLPTPRLVLDHVDVGNASDIQIKSVSLALSWSTLFTEPTPINQIELASMSVTPSQIKRIAGWLTHMQAQSEVQVTRLALRDITIQLSKTKLPPFQAAISLTPAGKVASATVSLVDQDVSATFTPLGDYYKCSLQAKRFTLPIGAPVMLQALKAEGVVDSDVLHIEHIQANLYGGSMEGNASFSWANDWQIAGKLNIKDASLNGLMPNFSAIQAKGDLTTEVDFSTNAQDIESIFDKPTLKARFTIDKGEVGWIDIIRAIQVAKKNMAINGATNFDLLTGQLSVNNGRYTYEQLTLKSGNMRATGAFAIQESQQLKGSIRVNLNTPSRNVKSTLQLSGSTTHPQTK